MAISVLYSRRFEHNESIEDEEAAVYGFTTSMTTRLKTVVRIIADSVGSERWTKGLHEDMKGVVQPLRKCELRPFP